VVKKQKKNRFETTFSKYAERSPKEIYVCELMSGKSVRHSYYLSEGDLKYETLDAVEREFDYCFQEPLYSE
jgi:hypothetical protein